MSVAEPITLSLHREPDTHALEGAMVVMHDAFLPQYGEAWTELQLSGMLDLPGAWMVLAHIGDRPAGFALVRMIMDEAELLLIAVRPDDQRRGVGRAMIDRVIAEIEQSAARLLHIEVRAGNSAIHFYDQHGFSLIGRRSAYYRGTDGTMHDALTYQRKV